VRRRQTVVPEQPRRFLERRLGREVGHRKSGDNQFAAFAVHIAQAR